MNRGHSASRQGQLYVEVMGSPSVHNENLSLCQVSLFAFQIGKVTSVVARALFTRDARLIDCFQSRGPRSPSYAFTGPHYAKLGASLL